MEDKEKRTVPELLCAYLNGSGSVFLPETWRDGAACVSLTGGYTVYREYVDGSYLAGLPFDVRIRTPRASSASPAAKLDAAAFYAALAEYIRAVPMTEEDGERTDLRVLPTAGGTYHKAAVCDDGTEEYRAGYLLKFYGKKE
ncbi:MAG: hypothetical protein ACI4V1_07075 [Eubacteriales bacterium]